MANIHHFGGNGTFTTTQPFTRTSEQSRFGIQNNNQLIEIYNAILEGDEKKTIILLNSLSILPSYNINETLNIPNNPFRYTLLHNAIDMKASTAIIKKLILLGADLNVKDKRGRTCYELLSTCADEQVIRVFLDAKDDQIREHILRSETFNLDLKLNRDQIETLKNDKKKLQEALDKVRLEKQNLQDEIMVSRKRTIELEGKNKDLEEQKKKLIKQTRL
jgi:ankyrin repeat protein